MPPHSSCRAEMTAHLAHLILYHHLHNGSLLGRRGAADDNAAALCAYPGQLLLHVCAQDVGQRAAINDQLTHMQRVQDRPVCRCATAQVRRRTKLDMLPLGLFSMLLQTLGTTIHAMHRSL